MSTLSSLLSQIFVILDIPNLHENQIEIKIIRYTCFILFVCYYPLNLTVPLLTGYGDPFAIMRSLLSIIFQSFPRRRKLAAVKQVTANHYTGTTLNKFQLLTTIFQTIINF